MGKFKSKPPSAPKRPGTALSLNHGRVWKHTELSNLAEGDIISGMGVVKVLQATCKSEIYLEAGEAVVGFYDPNMEVYAFTYKEI